MTKLTRGDIERSGELMDRLLELYKCPVEFGSLWHRGVLQTDGTRRKTYGAVHKAIAEHMTAHKRSSLVISRNQGKSTEGIDILLHQKWRYLDKRFMHLSAATKLSTQLIGELRTICHPDAEIELLPGLLVPFGTVFPELVAVRPGSGAPQGSFNVAGRTGTGREPCFMPSSIASNKAGMHPTDILMDDPSNERNSTTPEQRHKVIDAAHQLEPILRDPSDGHIWHIGTPWAFKDISSELPNMGYKQFRFGCWDGVNPDTGLQDGKGPGRKEFGAPNDGDWPLCPAYMNADELVETYLRYEQAGNLEFWAQQYLVKPIAATDALFTDDLIAASTTRVSTFDALPPGQNILLWDPTSAADAKVGDWNGLTLWRATTAEYVKEACKQNPAYAVPNLVELAPDDNLFFNIEAREIRGAPANCQEYIEDLHRRWGIDQFWVEDKASCGGIFMWLGSHHDLKRTPRIPIALGSHGANKHRRLQALQAGLIQNRIWLVQCAKGHGILTRRLSEYPKSESDDLPDSAALLTWAGQRKGALPKIKVEVDPNSYYNAAADPTSLRYRPQPPSSAW